MCACPPVALVVHRRTRSEDRHRGAGGLGVLRVPHDRVALKLDLDPHEIADLVLKVYPHGLRSVQERSAVYVTSADVSMSTPRRG